MSNDSNRPESTEGVPKVSRGLHPFAEVKIPNDVSMAGGPTRDHVYVTIAERGCVTIDVKQRGWRRGWSLSGSLDGGPTGRWVRRSFTGAGWQQKLADAAICDLRGEPATP